MGLLDFLGFLLDLYVWLIAGPRAIYRFFHRRMNPTPDQIVASATSEMQRFRQNVWLLCFGWLVLSIVFACLPGSSFWLGIVALALGLMFLPAIVEKRYDRLVAELRPKSGKP
jgi:hypothetical protein